MFSTIRKRLTYTNVALTLALVFTITGGAYAASKYVITSTKQIKPSVLAQLKGKAGPAGAQGSAGPQGTAGAAGPQGPAGPQGGRGETGPAGSNGKNGANGTTGPKGPTGPAGATGQTGFTETLPSGKTETGTWILRGTANVEKEFKFTAISFPIPLKEKLTAPGLYIQIGEGLPKFGQCKTGSVEKPEAAPGFLCVYEGETFFRKGGLGPGNFLTPTKGAGVLSTGTVLAFETLQPTTPGEEVSAEGTWAVTAE
jgi:hypothetical protein